MVTFNFVCIKKAVCNKFSQIPLCQEGKRRSESICVGAACPGDSRWARLFRERARFEDEGGDLWWAPSAGPESPPVSLEPLEIFLSNHDM